MLLLSVTSAALADDGGTTIRYIRVYGCEVPVAGEYALADVYTQPSDNYTLLSARWYDAATDAPLSTLDKFDLGHSYYLIAYLAPKTGYEFSDGAHIAQDDVYDVFGNSLDLRISDVDPQSGVYILRTEPISSYLPIGRLPVITSVTVSGAQPAVIGRTAAEQLSVPTGSHYYVYDYFWFDELSRTKMSHTDVFKANRYYSLCVEVKAAPGYYLYENADYSLLDDSGNACSLSFSGYDSDLYYLYFWTSAALSEANTTLAPKITAQPKSVYAVTGGNAAFTVKAEGKGLHYQWYVRGTGMPRTIGTDRPSLTLEKVKLSDSGLRVWCVVSNSYGTVASEEVRLNVANYVFPFTDVRSADWFYNDVYLANRMGLIDGKTATQFKPNDNMTCAEAVKLAACMNQYYYEGVITLENGSKTWYSTYFDYAVEHGIILSKGTATDPGIDYFYANAGSKITREMYVYLFARCLPAAAFPAINNIADNAIPDVPVTMGSWDDGVYLLYRAGVLQGSTVNGVAHSFQPDKCILRSEVAAILTRMMDTTTRLRFVIA